MIVLVTVLSLSSGEAGADEPLVPEALTGSFTASPGGFFVCTVTATSPVDTPDCFLGYVVPDGEPGAGRLRAVAGGFQRSSNFTVLEDVTADPGAFAVGRGGADVDVTFPELGRLRARLTAASAGPGWANSACPRVVLAYVLAGAPGSTVSPVSAVDGTLSRNASSEDVALYEAPRPVSCFAFFTGPAGGAWRMSHPHSAGHRRFEEPVPIPASLP
ncbi:MAG TPA: hypothetical protein VHL53_14925 [Acidimicrobiia bacterium]|nr:hypothetical protein [Acidimicrobiia bacterium]